MRVIFALHVIDTLSELIEVLYIRNYLGFKDSAIQYVADLITEIETTIHLKSTKKAPAFFSRYGKGLYYAIYKRNNNTQWYVFFNYEDDIYYIRYIGNNHTCAQYFDGK